jgi:hypothetical protein
MMRHLHLPLQLSILALTALLAGGAQAATQILGLVASNGLPTPLHCEAGTCRAIVNAFCLQSERPAPAMNGAYQLAPGSGLTIIAKRADGGTIRFSGDHLLSIRAHAGFTLVAVSLPEERLKALGVVTAAVEVAPFTSIVPVALADDPDPQTPEDIAQATGPMRHLAAGIFEHSGEDSDAARLVGLLINELPSPDAPQTVVLEDLLHRVVATLGPVRIGDPAIAAAERIVEGCRSFPANGSALNFCLEIQQHGLLGTLNQQLWDAAAGS